MVIEEVRRNEENNSVAFTARNLPRGVRQRFKAYCAHRGYTMGDAIEALMRKAAHENLELDV